MESANVEGTWFVLTSMAGKFICRTDLSDAMLLSKHRDHETVECAESYEFLTPVGTQTNPTNPQMVAVTKDAFVTPMDVVSCPTKVSFDLTGAIVMLFSSLSPNDLDFYKKRLAQATMLSDHWAKQRSPLTTIHGSPLVR